jgi:hypothetical protein
LQGAFFAGDVGWKPIVKAVILCAATDFRRHVPIRRIRLIDWLTITTRIVGLAIGVHFLRTCSAQNMFIETSLWIVHHIGSDVLVAKPQDEVALVVSGDFGIHFKHLPCL